MAPQPRFPSPEALLAERGWLRSLARRLVGDPDAAEDVVQETWITAVTRPPREGSALRPWLRKVLRNHALQWRRKEAGLGRRERAAAQREGQPSHEEMYDRMDAQRVLVEEVLALPEPFRGTVSLRFFEELDPAEIARVQGVEPATVRSRLKRGLDQLRARLDARYGGERQAWLSALAPFAFGPGWTPLVPPAQAPVPAPGGPGPLARAAAAARDAIPELIQGALTMNLVAKLTVVAGVAIVAAYGVSRLTAEAPSPRSGLLPVPPEVAAAEPIPAPEPAEPADLAAPAPLGEDRLPVSAPAAAPEPEVVEPEAAAPAPPSPARLEARFVDRGGLPVPGAVLERRQGSEVRRSAASEEDGVVAMELEAPGSPRSVTLVYHAPGFARGFLEALIESGETTLVGDVVLVPGGTVHGWVVDARRQPVPEAEVWFTDAELPERDEGVLRRQGPQSNDLSNTGGKDLAVRTDEHGAFTLAGAPAGAFRLWATAQGKRHTWSEPLELEEGGSLADVELVLEDLRRTDRIAGIVLGPDGGPARRALVQFSFDTESFGLSSSTPVKPDGTFDLVVWDEVPYDLTAKDWDGELGEDALSGVLPGTVDLVLRLALPTEVRLHVKDPDDRPIASFQAVFVTREGGHEERSSGRLRPLEPPEPGAARVSVPTGEFWLSVEAAGYAPRELGPFDLNSAPAELEVELTPTAAVRGFVLADGEPVKGARVELYALVPPRYRMECDGAPTRLNCSPEDGTQSDADGAFTLALEEDGRYVVRVSKGGFAVAESEVLELYAGSGLADLVMDLDQGGVLVVEVEREDGLDPAGTIVLVSRGDGRPRTFRADSKGEVRVELLTPGPWNVEAVDEELKPSTRTSMSSSWPEDVEWTLPSVCEVRRGRTTRYELLVPE